VNYAAGFRRNFHRWRIREKKGGRANRKLSGRQVLATTDENVLRATSLESERGKEAEIKTENYPKGNARDGEKKMGRGERGTGRWRLHLELKQWLRMWVGTPFFRR